MAIDKAEFDNGRPARLLYEEILEFLTKNTGKAYLENEITREMLAADTVLKTLTTVGMQTLILATLEILVSDGKVVARIPGVMPYYMAVQPGIEDKGQGTTKPTPDI